MFLIVDNYSELAFGTLYFVLQLKERKIIDITFIGQAQFDTFDVV